MKNFLLVTFFAVLFFSSKSVVGQYSYSFSQSTATYSNLTGATVITNPVTPWTSLDAWAPVNLGFTFTYFTHPFTSFTPIPGAIGFGVVGNENFFIEVFDDYITDRGTSSSVSPISYLVSGSTGNHIFKLEFKNFGFDDDNSPTKTNYGNMQLWMYETGRIELHFGASFVDAGVISMPQTGLIKISNTDSQLLLLDGSPASPTYTNYTVGLGSLNAFPASGTVYVFDPSLSTSITQTELESFVNVYPNPANDVLHISASGIKDISYAIVDMNGREILSGIGLQPVDVSKIEKGMYVLKIQAESAVAYKKFVIE